VHVGLAAYGLLGVQKLLTEPGHDISTLVEISFLFSTVTGAREGLGLLVP